MVTLQDRAAPATETPPPRRRWALVAVLVVVIAAAAAVAVMMIGGDDAVETPADVMDRMTAAIEQADPARFESLAPRAPLVGDTNFLEWNLALGMNPEFTNCNPIAGQALIRVDCDVAMGEDYFFSVVDGRNAGTMVSVVVFNDGTYEVEGWPAPSGLVDTERDMRAWIVATHPELEDRMFGADYADIQFSKEAGELHSEYLDEYLKYREANS